MKHSIPLLCAVAFSSSMMPSQAAAQSAQNDLRCLLVSNLFAKNGSTAKVKRAGEAGSFFYLGRLDGRMSPAQLKAGVREQLKTLTVSNAGQIINRCARHMEASAQSIQSNTSQPIRKK